MMPHPGRLRSWILIACVVLGGCDPERPSQNGSLSSSDDSTDAADRPTTADDADDSADGATDSADGTSDSSAGTIDGDAHPNKPLLNDWPRPEFALVLTGQQRGYIEPCGCTEGQSGGISRRASFLLELEEKQWPIAAFDLGETVGRNRRQSQIKFETMLAAMKQIGYRGLGLGPREVRFGPDFLLTQFPPAESADQTNLQSLPPVLPDTPLPALSANVVLYDQPELGTPTRWRVVDVGARKIGVTSVIGTSFKNTIFPAGARTDVNILDAEQALTPVVEQLKQQQPDLLVLLAYADLDESRALAGKFPAFDLIVSAGGPEDPDGRLKPVGKSTLITVGQKGKYCGVVGFYPDEAEHRLRFQLVELKKDRFPDDMRMVEQMRNYQQRLRQEELAATELPIRHPSGAEFVGAEQCGSCHTKAYKIWKRTPHARAFESLKHPRRGDPDYGITRIYDPECLACHVTGWEPQQVLRYETGFINEEFAVLEADKQRSGLLQGQQCESCHGPGSRHVELIDAGDEQAARELMRVTLKQAEEHICGQCHDLDNSPNFNFPRYWKRVEHHGMD